MHNQKVGPTLGLNARLFSSPKIRGFTRHTLSLLQGFRDAGLPIELHLFSDVKLDAGVLDSLGHSVGPYQLHESRIRPHLAWEQFVLPRELARHRIDVFHSTANYGVPAWAPGGTPLVVTVHDLITHESLKEWTGNLKADLLAKVSLRISWAAVQRAQAIITVSRYSADQILKAYPRLEKRVHVIPNGVPENFRKAGPGNPSERISSGGRPYFLYVGGFEARKNVGLLLQAMEAIPEQDAELVLVGDPNAAPEALQTQARKLGTAVRWAGYVPDSELVKLYQGARAAVVPSRLEGFGFQVVEAMACGTPVLSSDATSLPEVGGDAAAYFSPDRPEELIALLQRALKEPEWTRELSQKGLRRSGDFTWKKAAQDTFALYESLKSATHREKP